MKNVSGCRSGVGIENSAYRQLQERFNENDVKLCAASEVLNKNSRVAKEGLGEVKDFICFISRGCTDF